ncbi:MAG: hypothetical protein H0T20_08020 [Actinobacteria bacterium]|nr:hypothetical protein [Actinomycetota bacterium]
MSVLAAIRPDDWNFALLLHVLGAMLLVGGLTGAVTALWLGWRGDSRTLPRLGFKSLLFVAFPAWWLMRIAGQWIASKEGFDGSDEEPAWLGIGYITAEAGGLLILISILLTGLGVRRMRRAEPPSASVMVRIGTVLVTIVLAAYLVAVWAMSAKPD